jgi:RNA polymerase sigma-70 factor, ECF subfamily
MDEAKLVKCCKDNNAAAQKILYTKYVEDMMMLCLRYVTNSEDAKEVLMDGFLSFFKNIGGFTSRSEGSLKAWLKKIMVNQCLMYLRKQRPLFVAHDEMVYNEHKEYRENVLDYINAKDILEMIHALPGGCRTVFNLYVFEGMNHREIAVLLDISEGTSKSQLHRARALLKETILQTS